MRATCFDARGAIWAAFAVRGTGAGERKPQMNDTIGFLIVLGWWYSWDLAMVRARLKKLSPERRQEIVNEGRGGAVEG